MVNQKTFTCKAETPAPHHHPLHFCNCLSLSGYIGTRPEIAGLRVQRDDHLITPHQRGAFEGP